MAHIGTTEVLGTVVESQSVELANFIFLVSGTGIFASAVWIFIRRLIKKKVEHSSNTINN